jgi:hypothetical protein
MQPIEALMMIKRRANEVGLPENPCCHISGGSNLHKIIYECKDHQDPRNMTDWLKFLGTVYYAEVEREEEVFG